MKEYFIFLIKTLIIYTNVFSNIIQNHIIINNL